MFIDKATELISFLIQQSRDPLRLEGYIPCKTKLKYGYRCNRLKKETVELPMDAILEPLRLPVKNFTFLESALTEVIRSQHTGGR